MSTENQDISVHRTKDKGYSPMAYLFALIPLILLFFYKLFPFLSGLYLAFVRYDLPTGVNAWVGFNNFHELFSLHDFSGILQNTVLLKLKYILFSSIIAFVVAIILGFIRMKFWQRFFSAIFLFPYFLPTAVLGYLLVYTMANAGVFFTFSIESMQDEKIFGLMYPIFETIKNLGIPVFIALGAVNAKRESDPDMKGFIKTQLLPILKAIGLFILIQLTALLTVDYELISFLQTPGVKRTMETIDTFIYRTSFNNLDFGSGGAAWQIKYIVQLILSIPVLFLIKNFFKEGMFKSKSPGKIKYKKMSSIVAIVAGLFLVEIYLMLTTAPLAVSAIESFGGQVHLFKEPVESLLGADVFDLPLFFGSFSKYLFLTGAAVLINAIFTILLAYPLTVKKLPGKIFYSIFLVLILNIGTGGIHEFFFFKNRGLLDTPYPYFISGFFSLINVFVLKGYFDARRQSLDNENDKLIEGDFTSFLKRYLPVTIRPILCLSALQLAAMWNSFYPGQLLYLSRRSGFSPVMMFQSFISGGQVDIFGPLALGLMKLALMVSIPGIILLLLLMIFADNGLFIGQIRKS